MYYEKVYLKEVNVRFGCMYGKGGLVGWLPVRLFSALDMISFLKCRKDSLISPALNSLSSKRV